MMLDPGDYSGTYDATSGHITLDFANTLSIRNGEQRHEWLNSYSNLVAWGQLVGILSEDTGQLLLKEAERNPGKANRVLEQAITLREAIYRIFSAEAMGQSPLAADIDSLNDGLSRALAHLKIGQTAGSFGWDWVDDGRSLDSLLWPVAWQTANLLASEELNRVGECRGDDCGWLFIDMSRNHSRRWCDMGDCGNRAKARRHYERKKGTAQKMEHDEH